MLIAELSHNHLGKKHLLEELISAAYENGADAIKIQTFFADDLSPEFSDTRDRVAEAEIDWEHHKWFARRCKELDIIPITTVYSEKYLHEVFNSGIRYVKIGSPQVQSINLLNKCNDKGLKVIASTGGHMIRELPSQLNSCYSVLHCVSLYPAMYDELNMLRMLKLKQWFPQPKMGFSNHCIDIKGIALALYLGAEVIETHFSLQSIQSKDKEVSIFPNQLRRVREFMDAGKDRLVKMYPDFGAFYNPMSARERAVVEKYKRRWNV